MAAIPDWFVKKYYDDVHILAQQMDSKLRQTVRVEMATGESHFFDRLGKVTAVKLTSRHQATPITDPDHSRRRAVIAEWVANPTLDKQDVLRLQEGKAPLKDYARIAMAEIKRTMDDVIIDALGGTAYEGQDGATSVSFPTAQKIAVAAAGMTLTKVIDASRLLDEADLDPDLPRFLMLPPKGLKKDLMALATVTSGDYTKIGDRPLITGKLQYGLMDFNIIWSNRLKKDGNGDWLCYAWVQPAIGLALAEEIVQRLDERSDLNYAWQAYTKLTGGGTRIEDAGVVEIAMNP